MSDDVIADGAGADPIVRLQYGRTATYLLRGSHGSVLVDTDWAGTMPAFWQAIGQLGIRVQDIDFVMCTHWHPDHMGIVGDLQRQGMVPVVFDVQVGHVHDSDRVFRQEAERHRAHVRGRFVPVSDDGLKVVPLAQSRSFLASLGIAGEVVSTPSHSADSVSVLLDSGTFLVGDLATPQMVQAYGDSCPEQLLDDWRLLRSRGPRLVCFSHAGELRWDGGVTP